MNPILRVLFWLVIGASLLINAVVLGLWLRGSALRDEIGGTAFRDLPRAVRVEARRAIVENRAALRAALLEVGEARRAMFAAAEARPYDSAAVAAAMERVRDATSALQEEGQKVLLRAFDKAAERP
jgi:uncharacterized membrane protein